MRSAIVTVTSPDLQQIRRMRMETCKYYRYTSLYETICYTFFWFAGVFFCCAWLFTYTITMLLCVKKSNLRRPARGNCALELINPQQEQTLLP